MKRRTSIWTVRLIVASFGAALVLAAGPSSGGFAYAKSDKDKKEVKAKVSKPSAKVSKPSAKVSKPSAKVSKPSANAPKPSVKVTPARPTSKATVHASPSRDTRAPSSHGRGLLDRVRGAVAEIRRPERASETPSRPTIRPQETRRFETHRSGVETPRPAAPKPDLRSVTPSPPSNRAPDHGVSNILPSARKQETSTIMRPRPGGSEDERPVRGNRHVISQPPTTRSPAREVEVRPHPQPTRSGNRLLRPKPDVQLPREPAVVSQHEQRPVRPAPTVFRRPGKDGRQVTTRHFERRDHPRVDDAKRPLSPVPARESYFHRVRSHHPPQVDRPLDGSYFAALHRLQARRYYRVYFYHCAPYYYPYDYWYADYYVHYYYPCYYGRPYVVLSFPIFIERYHRVDCCPRDGSRVWYYYDREYDGYDQEYPYLTNYPGTLGRALRDIQRAWYDEEINYLLPHLQEGELIKIYRGDRYTHDLEPSEFVDLTLDAFDQTETDYYRYAEIKRIWGGDWARVEAEHVFWDADGETRKVYLSCLLERVRERGDEEWVLREVRQDSKPF